MNVRSEGHFVLLDKETRGLHTDDEVLAGDHFGLTLADFRSVAHCPCPYFPGREILRHIDLNLCEPVLIRVQFRCPEREISKVTSDRWLNFCRSGSSSISFSARTSTKRII